MIDIMTAVQSLRPNAECVITGADIVWHSPEIPQPTDAEIQAEVIRLQAVYDSQEYARNRKAEYDQLNQFEMQFDDLETGATGWQDAINEIKGRYPK